MTWFRRGNNESNSEEYEPTLIGDFRKVAQVGNTTVTWGGPGNDLIEVKSPGASGMAQGSKFTGVVSNIEFKNGEPLLPKGTVIKPA